MSEQHYEWARAEERSLARFIRPVDLPPEFRLPGYINRLDLLQAEGPTGVATQLYRLIRKQGIQYDLAPFNARAGTTQLIRTPATIVTEQRATCLDLSVLFATMCLANDLLPIIVIVEGHAFVGLSLTRTRHDVKKAPKALAWDRGRLTNLAVLQELAGQEYLLVESTGAVQSQSLAALFPEGIGREASGFMTFERACAAGQEQIVGHSRTADDPPTQGTREFLYALDIHDLQVNHGFEPIEKRREALTEGDSITVGDITGSTGVAIGRGAQATVTTTTGSGDSDLARLFADVYKRIEVRPIDPGVEKDEIRDIVKRIEQEALKREDVSEAKLDRWLRNLLEIAPDIFRRTVDALTSPVVTVSETVREFAERAKRMIAHPHG